jgi:hypothetical protein
MYVFLHNLRDTEYSIYWLFSNFILYVLNEDVVLMEMYIENRLGM